MKDQYNRVVQVRLDNLETGKKIEVKGLRCVFKIKKKEKVGHNELNLSIYNLSTKSRGLLQSARTETGQGKILVDLKVGYGSVAEATIFKGYCFASSEYIAPNWVTKLSGLEGVKDLEEIIFEKSYPAGTRPIKILEDISFEAAMGLEKEGTFLDTLPAPFAASGDPQCVIEKIAGTTGYQVTIQNGRMVVRENSKVPAAFKVIALNLGTGLVGKPLRSGEDILVDCLINPDIEVGVNIVLASVNQPEVNGLYTVKTMETTGDNWSGDWIMKLKLSPDGAGPETYGDE